MLSTATDEMSEYFDNSQTELASWNRERSNDELRSFVFSRHAQLGEVNL